MLALAGLALVVRLAAIMALDQPHDRPLTYEHGEIAKNLLAGRGFSVSFLGTEGPTSQQAPLYPFLLAGIYSLFGVETEISLRVLRVLQALAGMATTIATAKLAWNLVPERRSVGWLAGVGAALYPPHVYMMTHVQVAIWAGLVLSWLLVVVTSLKISSAAKAGIASNLGRPLFAGILAGLLVLIEPILSIAVLIAAASLARSTCQRQANSKNLRQASLAVGGMAVAAAIVVAPWLARNYRVHGEFVFVKSTFGYAFWQGNNSASWGTDKIPKASAERLRVAHDGSLAGVDRALWEARHETLYVDDVLLKPGGYREFQGKSEPARSRILLDRAWSFVLDDPGQYLRLCGRRLKYFLLFDETNPKTAHPLYRASTIALVALAVGGIFWGGARDRRLAPTYAIFIAVALFHSLTIVSARFRIPIEPLAIVWGAHALAFKGWKVVPWKVRRPQSSPPLDAQGFAVRIEKRSISHQIRPARHEMP